MEALFNNYYFLALYGFLIYTVLMFVIKKDEYDELDKGFSIRRYLSQNWDNWLLSLILVPVLATQAKDIWAAAMDFAGRDWGFYQIYYLGVGAVVEALYTLIKWVNNKRKKLSS